MYLELEKKKMVKRMPLSPQTIQNKFIKSIYFQYSLTKRERKLIKISAIERRTKDPQKKEIKVNCSASSN